MGPQVYPVPSDVELPKQADVVVIGGGIVGASSALFLAERGLDVVLLEKGHIAGEQSSRNWGWVRQLHRDPREFDLIRESLALWRGLDARVGGSTGYVECGILYGARDDKTVEDYRDWARDAAHSGIKAEIVTGPEVSRLLPGDLDPPGAVMICRSDGRAEPQKATPAIAIGARARGARIFADCAARGVETAGGKVVSVVSERGTIKTSNVVVAGGAWSRRLLRDLGLTLPQLKVRSSVSRTTPLPDAGPSVAVWDDVLGLRRREDGGFTLANGISCAAPITADSFRFCLNYLDILKLSWRDVGLRFNERFFTELREWAFVPYDKPSPYEACRVLDPKPDVPYVMAAFDSLKRRFPALADVHIVQMWAGLIDVLPDTIPVISPVETVDGLVVATGFSGHGFGIGPGAGHLVADIVTGAAPIADPHEFRFSRFTDGSHPKPLMGI